MAVFLEWCDLHVRHPRYKYIRRNRVQRGQPEMRLLKTRNACVILKLAARIIAQGLLKVYIIGQVSLINTAHKLTRDVVEMT